MKTTYLIKSIQSDGSTALVETSAEHWHEITENNKGLSYFCYPRYLYTSLEFSPLREAKNEENRPENLQM